MERLASRWKLVLLVTSVAGLGVLVAMLEYNTLQMSKDADTFRDILGDQDGRALVANVCDMIFAAGYGVLGVVAFRKLATGAAALSGMILVAGTALFDEIENVLVFLNVSRADSVTDGWIDAMTTVGAIKWVLAAASLVALAIVGLRALTSRRGSAHRP